MHHLTCGISFLLHSVNLILFTVLLVHLILHTSPHHSLCLQSQHPSLPQSFTPGFNPICSTNLILHRLDWIEQCFTSLPTQYRLYGRRLLQVKRPNQQYQRTEGTNSTQTNQTYNKQTWTQNTAIPLVYNNMGWLGDGSQRRQGCQAWTAVGLHSLLFQDCLLLTCTHYSLAVCFNSFFLHNLFFRSLVTD